MATAEERYVTLLSAQWRMGNDQTGEHLGQQVFSEPLEAQGIPEVLETLLPSTKEWCSSGSCIG